MIFSADWQTWDLFIINDLLIYQAKVQALDMDEVRNF